jgi:hypothetical protein
MTGSGYIFVIMFVIACGWAVLELGLWIWQRRRDVPRNNSPDRRRQRQ